MWFKTTDQNLIDKLMANDDTNVVYLISRAPTYRVETEKIITKHCNGTDFIEITKSTWKNENGKLKDSLNNIVLNEGCKFHN